MRRNVRAIHRWLSLVFAAFWLVQAVSGIFLVFHRETDDLLNGGVSRPLDAGAVALRIEAIEAEGEGRVSSIFLTSGLGRHFDMSVDAAGGATEIVRINGVGTELVRRPLEASLTADGIYLAANRLHRSLFAGPAGEWIVGISGLLLLSNLLLGLRLAWPPKGRWRHSLLPKTTPSRPANLFGWHRALGLWGAGLALVTVSCGVMLAFDTGFGRAVGAASAPPIPEEQGPRAASLPSALAAALQRFPTAEFHGVLMPSERRAIYQFYLRQADEPRRSLGATRVYVSAVSGRVLAVYDPLEAPSANRFLDHLLPVHTGQIGGVAGRTLTVAIGFWLLGMVGLGLLLWNARRSAAKRKGEET